MLKIAEIGIVLQSPEGSDFRYITFYDDVAMAESTYMLYKNKQPYLWKTIEKAETDNKHVHQLTGKIEKYNGVDLVIFEGESMYDAAEKQKWKFKTATHIPIEKVKEKLQESEGYQTDVDTIEKIHMKWMPLPENAVKIRFRYYHKAIQGNYNNKAGFMWTNWFEIVK